MIKFVLIRHGVTQWNASGKFQGQSDIPLSDKGIEQAEKLAANFPIPINRIISSPLQRAYSTGKILADHLQVPITTDANLMEVNFGAWEGLTMDEINQHWAKELTEMFKHPSQLVMPEGESFTMVQTRAMKVINHILANYQGETIGITAHGGILRTILCTMMHIPLDNLWCLRQDNTAVSIVTKYPDNDSFIIELINSTAHLQNYPTSTHSGL